MNWVYTDLVRPVVDLRSELGVGETLIDAQHHDFARLSLGIDGLFRTKIRERWGGWPRGSTTDGSSVVACTRTASDRLTAIGLMYIDFEGDQFPFKVRFANIGTAELSVTVCIGQLDPATGSPPRLRDAIITIGDTHATDALHPLLISGGRQADIVWTEILTLAVPAEPEPSPRLVAQRVRNRIIEYLELTSSFEAQRAYRERVPIADMPSEIINQWEDWVPAPPQHANWDPVVYSADELKAMDAFHATWDRTATATPSELPTLDEAQSLVEWRELRDAAAAASAVFNRRGPLPEDREI